MSDRYVCTLSAALQKQAKEELYEDPQTRQQDIDTIRRWLKKQPHINARTDDWNILRFLRGCKFSLERTKEKLDMFYSCKTAVPEWFANRDPDEPKMRELLELGQTLPLFGHDKEGRKVLIVRTSLHNPRTTSMDEMFKASSMIGDILMERDEVITISGMIQVIDMAGMESGHLLQMTPATAKKAVTIWQDGYPMRPKALHYINTPAAFDTVFSIFKGFMKDKMRKRVNIHGNDLSSLHKYVPPSILPIEYGGTNGSIDDITKYWVQKVQDRKKWLKDDEKYKVDESKRPGKPMTSSDLFGLEGSFRQLNVD